MSNYNEHIKNYIDNIFENVELSKKAIELRDELYFNMNEKYTDLLREGCTESEASEIVINGVGDISALLKPLKKPETKGKYQKLIPIVPMLVVVAYISISFYTGAWAYTWILFLFIPVIISGINVYDEISKLDSENNINFGDIKNINKYVDHRSNDSHLKNTYYTCKPSIDYNKVYKNLSIMIWSGQVPIYFIISFLTGAWNITWIIYIITPILQYLLKVNFENK